MARSESAVWVGEVNIVVVCVYVAVDCEGSSAPCGWVSGWSQTVDEMGGVVSSSTMTR
jgi:hypothetical protein